MEKDLDESIRANLLELAGMSIKRGDYPGAKEYMQTAKKYGERIKQPYVQRDEWMRPVDNAPLPTTKEV